MCNIMINYSDKASHKYTFRIKYINIKRWCEEGIPFRYGLESPSPFIKELFADDT